MKIYNIICDNGNIYQSLFHQKHRYDQIANHRGHREYYEHITLKANIKEGMKVTNLIFKSIMNYL